MYEDIYEQPMLAVQLFAHFLHLEASDEVYEKVVRHSQLQEMKCNASIGLNHLRTGSRSRLSCNRLLAIDSGVHMWMKMNI